MLAIPASKKQHFLYQSPQQESYNFLQNPNPSFLENNRLFPSTLSTAYVTVRLMFAIPATNLFKKRSHSTLLHTKLTYLNFRKNTAGITPYDLNQDRLIQLFHLCRVPEFKNKSRLHQRSRAIKVKMVNI